MFEADWKRRKIENTTELKLPVSYGARIPVRCVDGYQKLSGPHAVTCIGDTFYGLEKVVCYSEYEIISPFLSCQMKDDLLLSPASL